MTRITALTGDASSGSELVAPGSPSILATVPVRTQALLVRMFADPSLLDADERAQIAGQLQRLVQEHPDVADLRVVLGMALCVNLRPQAGLDQLGAAVEMDPHSFIAHLKLGELWMRLRVCEKAEEHTHRAARLARNPAQSQLARTQAATIRRMMREGIERGGYRSPSGWLGRLRLLRLRFRGRDKALAVVDAG